MLNLFKLVERLGIVALPFFLTIENKPGPFSVPQPCLIFQASNSSWTSVKILGFGVLVDAEKESSPANDGQIYWGGYFKTHFFIDHKEDLIAIFMTQKFPNSYEYVVELNKYIYKAIQ